MQMLHSGRNTPLAFVSASAALLYITFQSAPMLGMMLVHGSMTWVSAYVINRLHSEISRKFAMALFILVNVSLFYLAMQTGYVQTLDGQSVTDSSLILVAMGFPFYMLQSIGLIVDIAMRRLSAPTYTEALCLLFYFPKVISGPLANNGAFLAELRSYRLDLDYDRVSLGLKFVLLGLFLKFALGNRLEFLVIRGETLNPWVIALSTIALELRLYCDLGGYSLLAYGLAMAIGLSVPLNFAHPFWAESMADFWRRWHISLGHWFRDYIYKPLKVRYPGDTVGLFITFVVFFVSAMWHGVTLNFLLWGLLHGFGIVFYLAFLKGLRAKRALNLLGLWLFLVAGRFLFMESDPEKLRQKSLALLDADAWGSQSSLSQLASHSIVSYAALFATLAFIAWEGWSLRRDPRQRPYAMFLSTPILIVMGIVFVLAVNSSMTGFIYARQ